MKINNGGRPDFEQNGDEYELESESDTTNKSFQLPSKRVLFGITGAVVALVVGGTMLFNNTDSDKTTKETKTEQTVKNQDKADKDKVAGILKKQKDAEKEDASEESTSESGALEESSKDSTETESTTESNAVSEPSGPDSENSKAAEAEALTGLENSQSTVSENDRKSVADTVLAFEKAALPDVEKYEVLKPAYDQHSRLSDVTTLGIIYQYMVYGYRFDANKVKVFKSNNDNVLQFTATLTKANENSITVAGNYVHADKQLGFMKVYGDGAGTSMALD